MLAKPSWTLLSQLIPDGAALIALWIPFAPPASTSHSHAITSHRAAHAIRAPRTPRRPPGRSLGHTIAPINAYSSTAPGAPVSALAIGMPPIGVVAMNIIPNASPNHHTASTHANDTRIAGFVVRL